MGNRKKPIEKNKPGATKALEGLNISINAFGEIQSSYEIDRINAFLDDKVKDPKIIGAHRSDDGDPSKG